MIRTLLARLAITLTATTTVAAVALPSPAAAEPPPSPTATVQADADAARIRAANAPIRANPNAGKASTSPAKRSASEPCAEIDKQLASLRAQGVKRIACSTPQKQRTAAEEPPGGVPPGVPDWCKDETIDWYGLTRFNQCFWREEGIILKDTATNKVLGGIDFTYYVDLVTVWNEGAFIYGDHVWAHSEWGEYDPNLMVSSNGQCRPYCTVKASTAPKPLQLRTWLQFNTTLVTSVPQNQAETIDVDTVLKLKSNDFAGVSYATSGPGDLRCDNGMLKGSTNSGCVFSETWPTLTFKKSELPEITGHISRAQSRGNPGAPPAGGVPGSPLTRLYDDADAEENRSDACSYLTDPRPPNSSCDEYPFAHTYEGAYTGGGDWMSDFSAEWASQTEQDKQGGMIANLYRDERLLDADPFYVKADLKS